MSKRTVKNPTYNFTSLLCIVLILFIMFSILSMYIINQINIITKDININNELYNLILNEFKKKIFNIK